MIEQVPAKFQLKTNIEYPKGNYIVFEEWFMNYMIDNQPDTNGYTYLPIMWNSYYIEKHHGNISMSDLQHYLNELDTSKKYFTIVQPDDGVLLDIKHLDILVFGQCGGGILWETQLFPEPKNIGYAIPLNCMPTKKIQRDKDIFASFIGMVKGRHICREKMEKELGSYCFIKDTVGVEHINGSNYNEFIDVMSRSIFSLSPRGYGAASYRICESLQHGSIPVYISDRLWIPWKDEFDFNEIGISIHIDDIKDLKSILFSKTTDDIEKYLENGKRIYKEYFEYEGCAKKIIEKIQSERNN